MPITQITDTAITGIKNSNACIGRLMVLFDRGQNALEIWFAKKDNRLTTPDAVKIISEETGLAEGDILEVLSIEGMANV